MPLNVNLPTNYADNADGHTAAHNATNGAVNTTAAAVDAHEAATDPHGDRAYTDTVAATKAATVHTHAGTDIASGTVPTARLGSGTASSSTFLRGDQTWASSGTVTSVTAGDGTITVAGTSTDPTIAVGTGIAQSKVTNLTTDLAGKQPIDADLTTIAALDSTTAGALSTDGSGWVRKTYAQLKTALGLVKGDVGLGNVDNTADTAKPISTATQTALDAKAATTVTDALDVRLAAVELPEYATSAQTAAITATAMLSKVVRYDTTSGAINQTLPAATAGRVLAIGWDTGTNALTYTAAGSDVIGSGSATSSSIAVLGEVVTFHCTNAGRWRAVSGLKPTSGLDARYPTLATATTKGDLLAASAASVLARLAVGSNGQVLTADSTQTTGIKWAASSGSTAGVTLGQTPRSGSYASALTPTSTGAPAVGELRATYIDIAASCTVDKIGITVTTGLATATTGLAIYNHDATTGLPGTLLLDAGTVDCSTSGAKEITISQALSAGRYWLAGIALVAAATVRLNSGVTLLPSVTSTELGSNAVAPTRIGLSAFPAPYGTPTAMQLSGHRVYVHFS